MKHNLILAVIAVAGLAIGIAVSAYIKTKQAGAALASTSNPDTGDGG